MLPAITLIIGDRFIALGSYSTMMYLAAGITFLVGLVAATMRGLSLPKVAISLLLMAIATPVGARLWHASINLDLYAREPERLLSLDFGGFSMYGGLILAAVVGLTSSRFLALDVVRLADSVAPAIGLGLATMRTGCFMAGCCFGEETDLPWGVVFPSGSNAHLYQIAGSFLLFAREPLAVHPTQLIELTGGLLSAMVAGWLLYRKTVDGTAFLVTAILFSSFRWANYYLRALPSTLTVPEWFYPAVYFSISLTCLWLLARRYPLQRRIPHKEINVENSQG